MIVAGICASIVLFIYAIQLPASNRIRGDALDYISIASNFSSLKNSINYIGDRTYGYPFFLYIVQIVTSTADLYKSSIIIAVVQFLFHIFSCLGFYAFFLKRILQKSGLSNFAAILITAILISYPAFITYTTITLTDTFSVDFFMFAILLYYLCFNIKNKYFSVLFGFLCGLLFGYMIMVRPSFWPPVLAFYIACLLQAVMYWKIYLSKIHIITLMGIAMLIPISPSITRMYQSQGTIGIQNKDFYKTASQDTLQAGLSHVRVYWSQLHFSQDPFPGIKDQLLEKNYGSRCKVTSLSSLSTCLLSKPLAIPFYFGKKTMALFDVPHLQSYAIDVTPTWFTNMQRVFEIIPFCGFISLLISFVTRPFLTRKTVWVGFPLSIFTLALVFMLSLCHIEGRYGFTAIPLSVASLF